MPNRSKTDHSTFVERLQKALEHRGDRAALRKYWSSATRHHAYPILGKLGSLEDTRKTVLVALYAEHPEQHNGISLGRAALRLGERKDGDHPYNKQFQRLLACDDFDDLARQIHRLVKRLSREGIGLDYAALHRDLNFWADFRDRVKLRWAADFWQADIPDVEPQPTDA